MSSEVGSSVEGSARADVCEGLLEELPRTTGALRSRPVELTCVDANGRLVVMGTSVGTVFLHGRALAATTRLRYVNEEAVTALRCLPLDDVLVAQDQLAVGVQSGCVGVFRLPSSTPGKSLTLDQHLLRLAHRAPVVALQWSADGTKLFSGDAQGVILLTVVSFENRSFSTTSVCRETARVTQLSFAAGRLAFSTERRAALVVDWRVHAQPLPVGATPRKRQGNYGIEFCRLESGLSIVTARPGARLWLCGLDGAVSRTLVCKDLIQSASTIAFPATAQPQSFDSPVDSAVSDIVEDFGPLFMLTDSLLVTHGPTVLYIIDLTNTDSVFLLKVPAAFGRILSCSVSADTSEIFIVLANRGLLRVAWTPPPPAFVLANGTKSNASSELSAKSRLLSTLKNARKGVTTEMFVDKLRMVQETINRPMVFAEVFDSMTATPSDCVSVVSAEEAWDEDAAAESDAERTAAVDALLADLLATVSTRVDASCDSRLLYDLLQQEPPEPSAAAVTVTRARALRRRKRPRRTDNGAAASVSALSTTSSGDERRLSTNSRHNVIPEPVEESEQPTRQSLEEMLDSRLVELMKTKQQDSQEQLDDEKEECSVDAADEPADAPLPAVDVQPTVDEPVAEPVFCDYDAYMHSAETAMLSVGAVRLCWCKERLQRLTADEEASVPTRNDSVDSDTELFVERLSVASRAPVDAWSQLTFENRVVSVAGTAAFVAVVDARGAVRFASLADADFRWDSIAELADAFAISDNGKMVWRLWNGNAYALYGPSSLGPKGSKWFEAARQDITCVAVNSTSAWYLRSTGEVTVQQRLGASRPCFNGEQVECDWSLVAVACSDEAVWALRDDGRLVFRVGLGGDSAVGGHWVDITPDGPSELVGVALCGSTGWAVDTDGHLWFSTDVSPQFPFGRSGRWWQVALPPHANSTKRAGLIAPYQQIPIVACTRGGLFVAAGHTVHYTRSAVSGHRWKRAVPAKLAALDNFKRLAVGDVLDDQTGSVWLLRKNGELFRFCLKESNLSSLPPLPGGTKPVCMASTLSVLWVLDNKQQAFVRSGMDAERCPSGADWDAVDLSQLGSETSLVHVSCALDSVWAVDGGGGVWVRLGTGGAAAGGLSAAWVWLEPPPLGDARDRLRRVCCGADGSLVWACAASGRAFARVGVTHAVPIGCGWSEVEGLRCRHVALGNQVAWALDNGGRLHRRHRVGRHNPTGDYWKPVPAVLSFIAVTPHNRLWALDEQKRLVLHQVKVFNPVAKPIATSPDESLEGFELF